jgi:alpha-glucosidase (family GH31 glycosyl hydrolase)
MPVIRMLAFVFPDDPNVVDMWDEYMLGDAILVAPVTVDQARSRTVYLPGGDWIDYNDKVTRYTGPTTFTASAPLDLIPRYVKAGSIIPRGDILKANNDWTPDWAPHLRIEFFPADGVASSFDYYTGSTVVPVAGSLTGDTVTLQFEDLGTGGTADVYGVDGYSRVTRNGQLLADGTDFRYDPAAHRMLIPFSGAATIQITLAPSAAAGLVQGKMGRAKGVSTPPGVHAPGVFR